MAEINYAAILFDIWIKILWESQICSHSSRIYYQAEYDFERTHFKLSLSTLGSFCNGENRDMSEKWSHIIAQWNIYFRCA